MNNKYLIDFVISLLYYQAKKQKLNVIHIFL